MSYFPNVTPTEYDDRFTAQELRNISDAFSLFVPEDWHEVGVTGEPAFENSWVNFDTTRKARFYKDPLDVVHLSGFVKSGAVGAAIFTLPSGYYPSYVDATFQDVRIPVVSNGTFGDLLVKYDGKVVLQSGSNLWVSLDGISFRV